jgi:plastocyanin
MGRTMRLGILALAASLAVFASEPILAQTAGAPAAPSRLTPVNESGQIVVILEKHVFTPAEIHVPAGQRMQLLIKNLDATAEEFDSTTLKVEKVIAGRGETVVRLRTLDAGNYPFVGEYNSDTAKGVVIAE